MGRKVNLIDLEGQVHAFDEGDPAIEGALAAEWTPESTEAGTARTIGARVQQDYSGTEDQILAGLAGGARGLTLGGSDLLARAVGGEDAAYALTRLREANPGISTGTEIGGALLPAVLSAGATAPESAAAAGGSLLRTAARLTPAGATARLGAAIARTGEGAGLLAKVGAGAAGAIVEGEAQQFGSNLSDVALASDPLTIDRLAGHLTTGWLTTGVVSGLAGGGLNALEHGLTAAQRKLTAARETATKLDALPAELTTLDRKGLRAAQEAELAAIEAGRVPQRAQLAEQVAGYRATAKAETPWIAVATGNPEAITTAKAAAGEAEAAAVTAEARASGLARELEDYEAKLAARGAQAPRSGGLYAELDSARTAAAEARAAATTATDNLTAASAKAPRWMREQQKLYIESDKLLDRLLRNPKRLAEAPQIAKSALQQQEHVLELIASRADELRVMHLADTTGRRAAALEAIPGQLERNRALQAQIGAIAAPPASARLGQITDAIDALSTSKAKTLGEQMASGAAYGMVTDLVRSIPFVGPMAAPLVGARVADALAGKLGGRLAQATQAATARAAKAIDAFLTVTKAAQKVAPKAAPVLASKVLAGTRFAPAATSEPGPARPTLHDHFEQRSSEMARIMVPGPDGRTTVRPEVRAQIGARLQAVAALAPVLADRLETRAVARLEFLEAKRPRAVQIGMTKVPPTELAIRAWARYIAAADDPGAIEERLADGTVTPEDREVMVALYPDRMADITRRIVEQMATLRQTLPYQRRLALSLFTGAAVDAALDARILGALQAAFGTEPGTAGGTQAPRPQPAFGSLKKPDPTPAQRRAG